MERVFSKYSILRFRPDEMRDESVNIGIAVFHEGEAQFFFSKNDRKIQALAPGADESFLDDLKQTFQSLTQHVDDIVHQHEAISDLGSVIASEPAFLDSSSFRDVNEMGEHLLRILVHPKRLRGAAEFQIRTLRGTVEQYFSTKNLLSHDTKDLASHKVVKRFAIADDERLFADFAYRNGVMRFAQLLDLNVNKSSLASKLEESCKKAVALDKAAKTYGATARRFVLFRDSEDSDSNSKAALSILRDYSDEQFDSSNEDQLTTFYREFAPPQLI